jgi:hypothetical protein
VYRGTYQSQFVDGQGFAAGLEDAGTSSACEAHSGDGEFRNFEETATGVSLEPPTVDANSLPLVIGDSANDNDRLALVRLSNLSEDSGDGDSRPCKLNQRPFCVHGRRTRLLLTRDKKSLRKTTLLKGLSVPICLQSQLFPFHLCLYMY